MIKKASIKELRPKRVSQKNLAKSCIKICKESSNKAIVKTDNNIKRQEITISIIKTYTKIYKLKSYNKTINDPIHVYH